MLSVRPSSADGRRQRQRTSPHGFESCFLVKKVAKPRDRKAEYIRRKMRLLAKKNAAESGADTEEEKRRAQEEKQKLVDAELVILSKQMAGLPTDADRDIDFAYRQSGNPELMPLECPSLGAWEWYQYARNSREKFLDVCAKREDAKTKQAGTVTSQRMEDDKRKQFAIIDRIEKQLTIDVKSAIDDLMVKFPREVLRHCRKHKAAWEAFIAEECK